jgi:hypothetical protein
MSMNRMRGKSEGAVAPNRPLLDDGYIAVQNYTAQNSSHSAPDRISMDTTARSATPAAAAFLSDGLVPSLCTAEQMQSARGYCSSI